MGILVKIVLLFSIVTAVFARSFSFVKSTGNNTKIDTSADGNCSCDWRYLRHYEIKGCSPVEENACGCPEKYNCPSDNEIAEKYKVCLYKGKEYAVGSRINTTDVCQVCKCLGRFNPHVFCMPRECPPFDGPLSSNCHPIYKKGRCCPYGYQCVEELEDNKNVPTCEYGGRHYPMGARIYPEEDPCSICECDENWDGLNGTSCHEVECMMEKHKTKLDSGCIPVYHEKRCCPIEFYCPENQLIYSPPLSNVTEEISDTSCVFAGQTFEIGEELSINHPTNCIMCTCKIPPDFTCIHQSCPSAPNREYCYPYFKPGQCCPQYECLLGDATNHSTVLDKREMESEESTFSTSSEEENLCSDIKCDEGTKCMLYLVMCGNTTCPPVPTCFDIRNDCPSCESDCVVIGQDENTNCPTCACGEDINKYESTIKCQMPQCIGQNCRLVAGMGHCPVCECDEPCDTEDCPPGCNVLSEIEGRCPKCVCENDSEGCPTPICADETCRIESPDGGCPTCICGNKVSTVSSVIQQVYQQQQHQREFQDNIETENQFDSDEDTDTIQLMSEKFVEDTAKIEKANNEITGRNQP